MLHAGPFQHYSASVPCGGGCDYAGRVLTGQAWPAAPTCGDLVLDLHLAHALAGLERLEVDEVVGLRAGLGLSCPQLRQVLRYNTPPLMPRPQCARVYGSVLY